MSDTGVVIPNEINKVLKKRSHIWESLDEAQHQFNEMEKQSSQISTSTPAQIPSALTDEKTPPAEIAAAFQNFQTELAQINKARESINLYQAEIKRIKRQRLIIGVVVGLIVTIVLCAIVFGGISFINSLVSQ